MRRPYGAGNARQRNRRQAATARQRAGRNAAASSVRSIDIRLSIYIYIYIDIACFRVGIYLYLLFSSGYLFISPVFEWVSIDISDVDDLVLLISPVSIGFDFYLRCFDWVLFLYISGFDWFVLSLSLSLRFLIGSFVSLSLPLLL